MINRSFAVFILCVASRALAQTAPAGPTFYGGRIAPGTYTYLALSQGNVFDSLGVSIARVNADGPAVRVVNFSPGDRANGDLDTVTFDARTMTPIHVFVRGGGTSRQVLVDFHGNHAAGRVHVASNGTVRDANIDTTLSDGTLDDNQALFALVAIPWTRGVTWHLPVWSWTDGKVTAMTATATSDTTVTVPAGTFPCWKVALTGAAGGDLNIYITKAAPFEIARYEMTSLPMAFVLARRAP